MAGTIKLDGATFLEKDGGNYKITNTELKLKSSGNTIVDSSGNALVSESSGTVTLQGVTLGDTAVPNTPMMFRNKLINGNFDIWQRGTSQTSTSYGSVDRWNNDHSGSSKTASQQTFTLGQTEVPGNPKYYLRHVVTSVAGAGNYCLTQQKIEGVSTLAGKTVTLSFWAKADSSKNIATEFSQNFATGGSPSSIVTGIGVTTHSLTTSWQKFTTTVSIPSISGKTLGTDNNDYLHLVIWFESGSTYSSRNNSLGNQSGTFDIAQVQLEEGSAATPFEQRPIGTELSLCQRYYYNNYPEGVQVGTAANGPQFEGASHNGLHLIPWQHPVIMRTSPSMTGYNESGTSGYFNNTQSSTATAVFYQTNSKQTSVGCNFSGTFFRPLFEANAEL